MGENMLYQITGKQIDIGEALQTYVKSVLENVTNKYSQRPTDTTVVFSKRADKYVCEVMTHLSAGLSTQAKSNAHEIYAAFDAASKKLDKQLRRYKRRLKDHNRTKAQSVELSKTSSYMQTRKKGLGDSELEIVQPLIVAETDQILKSLSVSQAAAEMELAGVPALVFRNEGHNGVNVVYRRPDGNIGWVNPALQ